MKFVIPLGPKCGRYWTFTGKIYGPYKDAEAVKKEIACLWPDEKSEQALVIDGEIQVINVNPLPVI